jgi:hypothetical protein
MKTLKNGLFSGAAKGLVKTALCGLVSLSLAQSVHANLVQNGGFETTTPGANADTTPGAGQLGYNINATGWTTTASPTTGPYSYNFLFTSGSADTTGADGEYGVLTLYGPNNGTPNGLPATSPSGGNYVGLDSDVQYNASLSQTINGLTPGQGYNLFFYWAGAQQTTYGGTTTDTLAVSLGSQTLSTSTLTVANHGFDAWNEVMFNYTATSTSEVLSFLATGTPLMPNEPPFVLLDGVDLELDAPPPTPDLASPVVLLSLSLAALVFAAWRRSPMLSLVRSQAGSKSVEALS